jgi:hypothetical protein
MDWPLTMACNAQQQQQHHHHRRRARRNQTPAVHARHRATTLPVRGTRTPADVAVGETTSNDGYDGAAGGEGGAGATALHPPARATLVEEADVCGGADQLGDSHCLTIPALQPQAFLDEDGLD